MNNSPHAPHFVWFAAPREGAALLGAALRGGPEVRSWP